MKGLWWQSTQSGAHELDTRQENLNFSPEDTQTSTLKLFCQQLVTAFLIAGIILAMYVLYQWSTMLLLVVIGAITCIVTFRLLLGSKQGQTTTQFVQAQKVQEQTPPAVQEVQATPDNKNAPSTLSFVFPDTPMPSSPLVRILETIDLSASGIEHFIRTTEHPVAPKEQETSREYHLSE